MSSPKPKQNSNSLTWSLALTWVAPILVLAVFSRFTWENGPAVTPVASRPISVDTQKMHQQTSTTGRKKKKPERRSSKPIRDDRPSFLSSKPRSYQKLLDSIEVKRMDWIAETITPTFDFLQGAQPLGHDDANTSKPKKPRDRRSRATNTRTNAKDTRAGAGANSRAASSDTSTEQAKRSIPSLDPVRKMFLDKIEEGRAEYQANSDDIFKVVNFADTLRLYDVKYHDGGTVQEEAIKVYQHAAKLAKQRREAAIENGKDPKTSLSMLDSVNDEVVIDYSARSEDGMLCTIQCGLGKTYFMANMFEEASAAYSTCLEVAPEYLDARSSRGSTRIILGDYRGAASDFESVIDEDVDRRFQDAFTGLARVLQAKESASERGWEPMIQVAKDLIGQLEAGLRETDDPSPNVVISNSLNRLYHVLFLYHDVKTLDTDAAWEALTSSYEHKSNAIEPWNEGFEKQKTDTTTAIFRDGFWPSGIGSQSRTPIFIIGFVRSGSTLLERVLDSHPEIVGTGENSVFNGQLDEIRNRIVEISVGGDTSELASVIEAMADGVVDEMKSRWEMVTGNTNDGDTAEGAEKINPARFVDKMLTNYYNVGFIHMLFPNALILHVAREPMDTLLSAYKHEFPPGALDYTSFFPSLAEMYIAYRNLIDHWDNELPGRITHVRYEDMVNDLPTVAKGVIEKAGLEWNESVLDFHKKKHAVNTLSTTQVRKGVYKDSIQAWKRYEDQLQPLAELVGSRKSFDNLKTSLPGF